MHAASTLAILSRSMLTRNFAGWEVMEVFAGGVNNSDMFFKVTNIVRSNHRCS